MKHDGKKGDGFCVGASMVEWIKREVGREKGVIPAFQNSGLLSEVRWDVVCLAWLSESWGIICSVISNCKLWVLSFWVCFRLTLGKEQAACNNAGSSVWELTFNSFWSTILVCWPTKASVCRGSPKLSGRVWPPPGRGLVSPSFLWLSLSQFTDKQG